MRNTKQKKLIYEIIYNSYDHLNAKEVYDIAKQTIDNISLGTVYRILNELCNNFQIIRIKTKENIDRFDRVDKEHCHFICNKCNKIFDIYDYKLPTKLKSYKILSYDLIFHGLCNDCQEGED